MIKESYYYYYYYNNFKWTKTADGRRPIAYRAGLAPRGKIAVAWHFAVSQLL